MPRKKYSFLHLVYENSGFTKGLGVGLYSRYFEQLCFPKFVVSILTKVVRSKPSLKIPNNEYFAYLFFTIQLKVSDDFTGMIFLVFFLKLLRLKSQLCQVNNFLCLLFASGMKIKEIIFYKPVIIKTSNIQGIIQNWKPCLI